MEGQQGRGAPREPGVGKGRGRDRRDSPKLGGSSGPQPGRFCPPEDIWQRLETFWLSQLWVGTGVLHPCGCSPDLPLTPPPPVHQGSLTLSPPSGVCLGGTCVFLGRGLRTPKEVCPQRGRHTRWAPLEVLPASLQPRAPAAPGPLRQQVFVSLPQSTRPRREPCVGSRGRSPAVAGTAPPAVRRSTALRGVLVLLAPSGPVSRAP